MKLNRRELNIRHYVERARVAGGGMLATACFLSDSCKDDDHQATLHNGAIMRRAAGSVVSRISGKWFRTKREPGGRGNLIDGLKDAEKEGPERA